MKRAVISILALFASRLWRPGVAEACLALQDTCDADVNLLLYGCWHRPQKKRHMTVVAVELGHGCVAQGRIRVYSRRPIGGREP